MCLTLISGYFVGFLAVTLFSNFLGTRGVQMYIISLYIYLISILLWCIICVILNMWFDWFSIYTWLDIGLIYIRFQWALDATTCIFILLITVISVLALIYSICYMQSDPHIPRFYMYYSLFTFFMIFLVMSQTLLQLFIAWEGVGICSYLLISFWSGRFQASKSSILAILVNKVGDICFLVSACVLQNASATTSVWFLSASMHYFEILWDVTQSSSIHLEISFIEWFHSVELFSFCLFIAAMGKSAQFLFHIWLPEAMEGPTPVSALIHAATMVTVGIYVVIRFSDTYVHLSTVLLVFVLVGAITIFFSTCVGVAQDDIKKVVAYSTCSQLGYMLMCCGASEIHIAMYHLILHAFFKALLFFGSGYLIFASGSIQSTSLMGGFVQVLPFVYITLLCGSLASSGIPDFGGTITKEYILDVIVYLAEDFGSLAYSIYLFIELLIIICVLLSIVYTMATLLTVFFGENGGYRYLLTHLHFPSIFINIALFFLSVVCILFGYVSVDLLGSSYTSFWGDSFSSTANLGIPYTLLSDIVSVGYMFEYSDNHLEEFFIVFMYCFELIIFCYIFFEEECSSGDLFFSDICDDFYFKVPYIVRFYVAPIVFSGMKSVQYFSGELDKGVINMLVQTYPLRYLEKYSVFYFNYKAVYLYHFLGFNIISCIFIFLYFFVWVA